jgi:hypothetical protein
VVPALGRRAYSGGAAVGPTVRGARPTGMARSRRCTAWADSQEPRGRARGEGAPRPACGVDAEGRR